MSKHIKDDDIINEKKVKSIENVLNKHANFWVKMTNAGQGTKQEKRIKSNVKTKDNEIPLLSGTSTDHKEVEDPRIGPDVRPIMGAMVGPNVGLTNFGNLVIRAIADVSDEGLVSKSTEETIAKLEDYNSKRIDLNVNSVKTNLKVIIGSMDIDKWYPSTKSEPSAKNVREMYETSELEIAGIDFDKVSKYLGEFLTEDEIKIEGFEEIVYTKIKKARKNKKNVTKNIAKKKAHKPVTNVNIKRKGNKETLNTKASGGKKDNDGKINKSAENVNIKAKSKDKP